MTNIFYQDAHRDHLRRRQTWEKWGFVALNTAQAPQVGRSFLLIHANDLPAKFAIQPGEDAIKLPTEQAEQRQKFPGSALLYFSGGENPLDILRPYGAAERPGVHFYAGRTDQVEDAFARKVKELVEAWPAGQPEPEWKRLGSWLNEARVFAGEQILAQAAGLAPSVDGAVAHPFDVNGIKWGESQNLLGDWLKAAKAVQAAMSDPDRRGLENACSEFLKVTS